MTNLDDWRALYGPGVIERQCGDVTSYVALTSPSAWRAVEPLLPAAPAGTAFVTNQEEDYLQEIADDLPKAQMVLGIGGGKALDAAKFVAGRTGRPFMLIPTIVSTGAVFNPGVPARRSGRLHIIDRTLSPEAVLFDTEVIRAAPPYLNAAGMAECICWLGGVASWKWWVREGLDGLLWDDAVADETINWVETRVADYVGDLDAEGRPGERAIRAAAEVNRERHHLKLLSSKAAHIICHLFDNTFLLMHGRDLRHGEAVALGALIGCHLYGWGFDEAKGHFEACGTRFRPRDIGCTWDEARATLGRVAEHADCLGWPKTFFHYGDITDSDFGAMARRIDA